MIQIYYKATCSTCRNALKYIKENTTEDVELVKYTEKAPTQKAITELIRMLGIEPEQLVRKKEKIFKEKYAGKKLTGREWVREMSKNPVLIERPVVIKGTRAIIGRPAETVIDFVKRK